MWGTNCFFWLHVSYQRTKISLSFANNLVGLHFIHWTRILARMVNDARTTSDVIDALIEATKVIHRETCADNKQKAREEKKKAAQTKKDTRDAARKTVEEAKAASRKLKQELLEAQIARAQENKARWVKAQQEAHAAKLEDAAEIER